MRLHTLALLLALSACKSYDPLAPEPDGSTVVAKAPDAIRYRHEKHPMIITIGSLVARNLVGDVDRPTYKAAYSITTEEPFMFGDELVITCNVYDSDNVLAGGSGISIGQAPTGGLFEFQMTHRIEDGHIACNVANGKGFTRKVFP